MIYMQSDSTALHEAKSVEIVKVLISKGAQVNKRDSVCVAGLRLRAWVHGMRVARALNLTLTPRE